MAYRLLFLFMVFFAAGKAQSHPVSFKDAVSLMSYNGAESSEMLLTYSFNHRTAAGAYYLREQRSEFYIPRANFLLHRWNQENSQGNIYFSGGYGLEKFDGRSAGTGLAEFIADWESRRYYILWESQYIKREMQTQGISEKDLQKNKLRLGFAPFLADYQDLNIWYILEFNHLNQNSQVPMTQFLRFYMKNVLWEIGAVSDGSFAFNFMLHL